MNETRREHADIRLNPDLQEWFCAACGRTSDHAKLEDARQEIEHFRCELPSVEIDNPCRTMHMLDLRVGKWVGSVPLMGECISCGRQFHAAVTAVEVEDALENIRQQFVRHECEPVKDWD